MSIIDSIKYRAKRMMAPKKPAALLPEPLSIQNNLDKIVPVVKLMAQTGVGTDECLQNGCIPMPVHFYSPIPDIEDLRKRNLFSRISPMTGVDFAPDRQLELLQELGAEFGSECLWPHYSTDDKYQFFTENGCFCFGCAVALHSMIRKFKPRRIIEVGAGNSSLVISAALSANNADGVKTEYTIIEPYPWDIIKTGLPFATELISERLELADISLFGKLEENDILFIDSSHVVKTGSDVNAAILDILPVLKPGVLIHFHDIHLPFEYDEVYFTNPGFRVYWTESYLLQAFLAFNSDFETLLGMAYLMKEHNDSFRKAFPAYNPEVQKAISGSYWIRRKK